MNAKIDIEKLEQSVRLFFEGIGDDPNRDGIRDSPKRVAKMWAETMNGYTLDPADFVTMFENDNGYDGPVVLRDAEFYTVCEHHLQPFAGTIDIAYQPGARILGLSKLLRVARVYAKRPQNQERLTKQVTESLFDLLEPAWVVVRIKAEHHCMKLRGVRVNGSYTETRYQMGQHRGDILPISS
jgi:GTP cyclohydrolase IA